MALTSMYRLWLHGLYGLYGPWCPLSPKRLINFISLSLTSITIFAFYDLCTAHAGGSANTGDSSKCFTLHNALWPCYTIQGHRMHELHTLGLVSSVVFIFRITCPLRREFTSQRWIPPHKGQWHGALMFSLICAWMNAWVNNHEGWWFQKPSCSLWRHCNVLNGNMIECANIILTCDLKQCWPRFMSPYGGTRPQWVNHDVIR